MRIEDGVISGNVYDKYGTRNPVARYLQRNYQAVLLQLIRTCGAREAHEVGCGAGYLSVDWNPDPRRRLVERCGALIRLYGYEG